MSQSTSPEVVRDLVSYKTLRKIVGILGVSMPFLLMLWGLALHDPHRLLDSISDYYAFRTRDLFVGVLFTIGWFLFTYRGYDDQDERAGNAACVFALGVAFFPCTGSRLDQTVHYVCATLMFLVLAYFSYFLFTKTSPEGRPSRRKKQRNLVYKVCGVAIVVFIALIGLYKLAFDPQGALAPLRPVFWLETFILVAFGVSWFVKGEGILADE
jgi:hypothetical protein